jgi:hypothetical protein
MMRIAIVILALAVTGCAVGPYYSYTGGEMIPGRLISLEDGHLIAIQIELSTGAGKIIATDQKTGEIFSGNYTAVSEDKYIQYTRETFWGTERTQQAIEASSSVPATAILVGDKGTVINISMRIRPGGRNTLPIGYGEGLDNKGNKYNFQF